MGDKAALKTEFVQSAHQHVPLGDEHLIDAAPTGALLKADNPKIVLEAVLDRHDRELGVVDPHAMQDHGKSSRERDFGFFHSCSLGELGRPALEGMILDRAGQDDVRGLVKRRAHHPSPSLLILPVISFSPD